MSTTITIVAIALLSFFAGVSAILTVAGLRVNDGSRFDGNVLALFTFTTTAIIAVVVYLIGVAA